MKKLFGHLLLVLCVLFVYSCSKDPVEPATIDEPIATKAHNFQAGTIAPATQTIRPYISPALLTSSKAATSDVGGITYQWQMSTNNSSWTNITGATSAEYQPSGTAVAGTRYFRRQAKDASGQLLYSNTVTVVVSNSVPPVISAYPTTFPYFDPTPIYFSTPSIDGSYEGGYTTYEWEVMYGTIDYTYHNPWNNYINVITSGSNSLVGVRCRIIYKGVVSDWASYSVHAY